jgi:hypothetical protein
MDALLGETSAYFKTLYTMSSATALAKKKRPAHCVLAALLSIQHIAQSCEKMHELISSTSTTLRMVWRTDELELHVMLRSLPSCPPTSCSRHGFTEPFDADLIWLGKPFHLGSTWWIHRKSTSLGIEFFIHFFRKRSPTFRMTIRTLLQHRGWTGLVQRDLPSKKPAKLSLSGIKSRKKTVTSVRESFPRWIGANAGEQEKLSGNRQTKQNQLGNLPSASIISVKDRSLEK